VEESNTGLQISKQITSKTIPRIKPNVVLDKLRFNILDIANNVANNKHVYVYPNATFVIFDPDSDKLLPVSSLTMEFISLFNCRKNIQMIASGTIHVNIMHQGFKYITKTV
jgi:hypothetical protein